MSVLRRVANLVSSFDCYVLDIVSITPARLLVKADMKRANTAKYQLCLRTQVDLLRRPLFPPRNSDSFLHKFKRSDENFHVHFLSNANGSGRVQMSVISQSCNTFQLDRCDWTTVQREHAAKTPNLRFCMTLRPINDSV